MKKQESHDFRRGSINIIHIISDTFRRDNLAIYGGKGYTPSLNAFAEKCVVFDKAYVCGFPTVPIRGELVTGQVSICRRGWEPLKRDVPVIADDLTNAGIVSMMIADTPHHLNNGFLYNRGFTGWKWIRGQEGDHLETQPYDYESKKSLQYREYTRTHPNKLPGGLGNHLRNMAFRQTEADTYVAQTMQTACDWLERNHQHKNFYLMVDTFDPHEPWDAPEWYLKRFDGSDYDGPEPIYPPYGPNPMNERETERLNALYRAEASLADNWIGQLLRKIDYMGLMENTMVIFMADHGFLLGEHGLLAKNLSMYEEVIHIPLMVYHPDATPRHTNALASIIDIPPTVIDVLDVEHEAQVEGNSLLPIIMGDTDTGREYTVTHGAWVGGWSPDGDSPHGSITDGIWSLLLENQGAPKALFHLPSDPEQMNNRFESDTSEARRLYQAFLDFLGQHGAPDAMVTEFQSRWQD